MDNPNSENVKDVKKHSLKTPVRIGTLSITKDKLIIIIAMTVFALVLISVALILTFGGDKPIGIIQENHEHDFDMHIEAVDGKINLVGRCTKSGCDEPEYLKENVQGAVVSSEELPTCDSDGKRVYTLNYGGEELTCEEVLEKTGHVIGEKNVAALKNEDGYLLYDGVNVFVPDVNFDCGDTFSSDEGFFRCSDCHKTIGAAVLVPHLYEVGLTHEASAFYMTYECRKLSCKHVEKQDVTSYVTQTGHTEATCCAKETTYYEYSYGGEVISYKVETGDVNPDNHPYFNEAKNDDGTFDYVQGYSLPFGKDASISESIIKCGSTSNQFYWRCRDCKKQLGFAIRVIVPDHSYEVVVNKYPGVENGGKVTLKCNNSWCTEVFSVNIEKIVLGEGGNTVIRDGKYYYKTTTDDGVEIELVIPM